MKKIILTIVFLATAYIGNAQEVGIRFGEVVGGSVAVDALFPLGEFSKVHADVSFGDNGVGLEALWDCLYKPLGVENMNWYAGFGPATFIGDDFFFGASGEIGLDYRFDEAPIVIGLDWRPTFWIVEETDFDAGGFGLNIRYVF